MTLMPEPSTPQERIVIWTCNHCGRPIEGTICIACGDRGATEVEYVRPHRCDDWSGDPDVGVHPCVVCAEKAQG